MEILALNVFLENRTARYAQCGHRTSNLRITIQRCNKPSYAAANTHIWSCMDCALSEEHSRFSKASLSLSFKRVVLHHKIRQICFKDSTENTHDNQYNITAITSQKFFHSETR